MGSKLKMGARFCLDCGTYLAAGQGNRCPTHTAAHQRQHNAARKELHTTQYLKYRAATIAKHIRNYGLTCPGAEDLHHPPHPVLKASDLTLDHIIPRSSSGSGTTTNAPTNLRILCRSANSRRGAARRTP